MLIRIMGIYTSKPKDPFEEGRCFLGQLLTQLGVEKLHWESDKRLPVYETTLRRHYFPLCLGKIQSCDQDSEGFLRGLEPTDTRLFLSLLCNFPTHTHTSAMPCGSHFPH